MVARRVLKLTANYLLMNGDYKNITGFFSFFFSWGGGRVM